MGTPTYQEAKEDKNGGARHLFLRGLEVGKPRHVADLIYSDIPIGFEFYLRSLLREGAIDSMLYTLSSGSMQDESLQFLTFTAPSHYGRRVPQKIFIKPKSFENLTEEEFLNGLKVHEYTHTQDAYDGIPVTEGVIDHSNMFQLQADTFLSVKEIRAHLNELEGLVKKGMRDSRAYSNALHGVNLYGGQLLGVRPDNDFENQVRRVYLGILRDRLSPIVNSGASAQPSSTY